MVKLNLDLQQQSTKSDLTVLKSDKYRINSVALCNELGTSGHRAVYGAKPLPNDKISYWEIKIIENQDVQNTWLYFGIGNPKSTNENGYSYSLSTFYGWAERQQKCI